MGYTIYFFLMDAADLARRFRTESQRVVAATERLIRKTKSFDDDDVCSTVAKVAEICERRVPYPAACDAEYFHALCWLAEAVGEKIVIGSFQHFRRINFLDEVAVWPWFHRTLPPFPLPRGSSAPDAGFIPVSDIEGFALPQFALLKRSTVAEVNYARQELQEVMESLVQDRLDLLAILL